MSDKRIKCPACGEKCREHRAERLVFYECKQCDCYWVKSCAGNYVAVRKS